MVNDEKEVLRRSLAFQQLLQENDLQGLASLLDEAFYAVSATGVRLNKAAMLAAFAQENNPQQSITDLMISVYDAVATETGLLQQDRKLFRYSNVWVKDKGEWLLRSTQHTAII